jgi:hypothetical protein
MFAVSARWSISWAATPRTVFLQRSTASICAGVRPSAARSLRLNAAKRYSHISACSISAASQIMKMSASRCSMTRSRSGADGPEPLVPITCESTLRR